MLVLEPKHCIISRQGKSQCCPHIPRKFSQRLSVSCCLSLRYGNSRMVNSPQTAKLPRTMGTFSIHHFHGFSFNVLMMMRGCFPGYLNKQVHSGVKRPFHHYVFLIHIETSPIFIAASLALGRFSL